MGLSLERIKDARAVLIAGPTASGKSALALDLAEMAARAGRSALIVNADSMQVYDALRVLTARPSVAEERQAPHKLYGHVPAAIAYSAGSWLREVAPVLSQAFLEGALPLVVGGTGLYFSALTKGIASVPQVPPEIRRRWSERLADQGPTALHRELSARDPATAAAIRPTDRQRIVRALEVLDATGMSLRDWRANPAHPPILGGSGISRLVVELDRAELYGRIDARFDRMVQAGAIEEVRSLLDQMLPPDLPAMKAIGVRSLANYLRGERSLEWAASDSKLQSRHYAKRQMTWFRNQLPDWDRLRV